MSHKNFKGADVNIAGTVDDEVPLVTAVKSSSARCVKEILQMYPKQLHVQVRDLKANLKDESS